MTETVPAALADFLRAHPKPALAFSGGTEQLGYSFGASMSQNTGTIIHDGNEQKKYDIRFGSSVKLNSMLKYTNSFGFVAEDYKRNRNGNQGYYTGLFKNKKKN